MGRLQDVLPVEMLAKILSYLNPADRREVSMTCPEFLEASQHKSLLQDYIICFDYCHLVANSPPVSIFENSFRNFFSLKLGAHVKISDDLACFWRNFGNPIEELVVQTCEDSVLDLLKFMPNLKMLRIENNGTSDIGFSAKEKSNIRAALKNVKKLSICKNFVIFEDLIEMMPNLERLKLEGFTNRPQATLQRRSNLSLDWVLNWIKEKPAKCKEISLIHYSTDRVQNEKFLKALSETNDLKLEKFACSIESVSKSALIKFFESQKLLKSIDLTDWNGITNDTLKIITSNTQNLEEIVIRGKLLDPHGLEWLKENSKLQKISFKDSFAFEYGWHLKNDLAPKPSLQELEIDCNSCLNRSKCFKCFEMVCLSFPNLTVINFSKSMFDDANLQVLFRHMIGLKELYMNECKNISDSGLNGLWTSNYTLKNLKNLRVLELNYCQGVTDKSLIRSFRLVALKRLSLNHLTLISASGIEMVAKCCPSLENLSLANCSIDDFCIASLSKRSRRLRVLDISGCKSLTKQIEVSLCLCKNLQTINATGLDQIGLNPIQIFGSITTLKLLRCKEDYTRPKFLSGAYDERAGDSPKFIASESLRKFKNCMIMTRRKQFN